MQVVQVHKTKGKRLGNSEDILDMKGNAEHDIRMPLEIVAL